MLTGSTVHFDWLNVWKASVPVLPKTLQINTENSVNGLDLSFALFCSVCLIFICERSEFIYNLDLETNSIKLNQGFTNLPTFVLVNKEKVQKQKRSYSEK